MFYGCKIISTKTGATNNFHQIIFARKFFMVVKSFPRKPVPTKNFDLNFLVRKGFMVAKSFPREQVLT